MHLLPTHRRLKSPECSASSSLQRSVVVCEVKPRSVRPCGGGAPGVGAGPRGTCHRHGHCARSRDEPKSLKRCAAKPPSKQGVKMLCTQAWMRLPLHMLQKWPLSGESKRHLYLGEMQYSPATSTDPGSGGVCGTSTVCGHYFFRHFFH